MRKKIGLYFCAFFSPKSIHFCSLVCEWSIFFQIRIYFFGSDRRRHSSRRKTRLSRHSTQKAPIVVQYTQYIWKSRKKGHRKFNDDLWQKRSSVVTWILKCLQYLVQSYLCMWWHSPWEMMLVCRYWMTSLHIYGH